MKSQPSIRIVRAFLVRPRNSAGEPAPVIQLFLTPEAGSVIPAGLAVEFAFVDGMGSEVWRESARERIMALTAITLTPARALACLARTLLQTGRRPNDIERLLLRTAEGNVSLCRKEDGLEFHHADVLSETC